MNGYGHYNGAYDGCMDHNDDGTTSMMQMMSGADGMAGMAGGMVGGQSLDDIVNQNAKMIRRQSMPVGQNYGASPHHMNPDMRRISMMDYGSGSPAGSMNSFQYDPNAAMEQSGYASGGVTPAVNSQQPPKTHHDRRPSAGDLSLDTSFQNNAQHYTSMMAPNSAMATSPAHPSTSMDMSGIQTSPYIDAGMGMTMDDYGVDASGLNSAMSQDAMQMNLYNQPQFNTSTFSSPMHPSQQQGALTPHSGRLSNHDQGGGTSQHSQFVGVSNSRPSNVRQVSRTQSLQVPDHLTSPAHITSPHGASPHGASPLGVQSSNHNSRPQLQTQHSNMSQQSAGGFPRQPQHPVPGSREDRGMGRSRSQFDGMNGPVPIKNQNFNPNNQNFPWELPEGGWPSTMAGKPHIESVYKNAYSSTGFDMLGVLMRVATRPNPEINIGSVDLSCAFVVCDAEKDDFPIVYCSENFERLTGYTKHMILGRNCRFLQSPDGNVAPGIRRKYVDDDSVLYLKNMINLRREAQISLINYRRGGQPFMNLLTMIPISWDTEQVKFFVGFQVDLVEQPNAVTNKNPDGSYSINYQRGMTMPRYVMNAPDPSLKAETGQTVPRDDVSAILSTIGSGESEYAKRMWDKVLLENTDDVVHVLSLKGLFQWISPSALRVLEYEPSEIIGTALSSVCHPSDIVPVTRELKDTSTGASVNVVFRIRRKNSGYMWFEGHGSLHTEQGKGRKSIIMVGRERPVYALSKNEIVAAGGIGENELWTKMSTSGMFLYVSSNVRQLLDRQPDELVGVSIQSLMRTESKTEFGRILEHARTGKKASVKHEMINRRGQVLSAFTTLYPGDAVEGQKPTFIVAQTRLIKFSRGTPTATGRPAAAPKKDSSESVQSLNAIHSGQNAGMARDGDNTPNSNMSGGMYRTTNDSAATYAGVNGLLIGHQDQSLASDDNLFDELKTTKSSSWQYEIRQLEKRNRMLAEEVQSLIAAKKKRKRRKGAGNQQKDCANCHTRVTPEWRRGPSGQRDLCNSCGLRWAKLNGRVSPRTSSQHSVHSAQSDKASKASASPRHASLLSQTPQVMKTEQSPPEPGGDLMKESPSSKTAQRPQHSDGHAATMEGAVGVPGKIDEGVEPD
ncbi:Putative PAS domain, Zinc finger, GATA-type, Zinc finger, NHR/GATA-type, PAS domain superfamily [Septoria linicola]|uniref:PAS domain, Zinc finger, GATA-type, Zinc finger, NHR/GATA-type, PAS domain superfamily n=1 Tax=Septoria linicola TaxID=215465 RepID=A0A9Q9EQS4_9PEZI|nr:putative PAS domain, Zinc finger, GATA-type, Zinc finger, NHR/GATA-type, PAS domain superfamily [Septoria linicola]USW59117.1 Putative PAS domain, Zinc finger, GATA-type, Zinc finger, NHR/GATA-type, PAS domain superfamily [Septoria linicola]